MNKETSKKVLSLLLTVVLVLGLMPVQAFAEGGEPVPKGEITAFAPFDEETAEQTVP